jgi:hypothetical protein
MMSRLIHGTVHGKTIIVAEDLGLADGQEVELMIRAVAPLGNRQPGDGFLSTEGALADDSEWDTIMEELRQARKQERRSPTPDLVES